MSMSTYVLAVRDLTKKFNTLWNIKEQCDKADISYPKEVIEFFGDMLHESREYTESELLTFDLEEKDGVKELEGSSGFEVELSKLPKDIKKIRFVNSW